MRELQQLNMSIYKHVRTYVHFPCQFRVPCRIADSEQNMKANTKCTASYRSYGLQLWMLMTYVSTAVQRGTVSPIPFF